MRPRTSIYTEEPPPPWQPPPPEQQARDVELEDVDGRTQGAKKFANAALKLGYGVNFRLSRGPWMHKTQESYTVRDALVCQVLKGDTVVAIALWLRKDNASWSAEVGMIRSLLGRFTVTQVSEWLAKPEEDPRD